MTHPKQNTQAPAPNTAPRTLNDQIEQAKREFTKRKRATRSNKARFVSPSVAKRMQMMTPMPRQYYDNPSRSHMTPRSDSNQCRILCNMIAHMFPAVRTGGAV